MKKIYIACLFSLLPALSFAQSGNNSEFEPTGEKGLIETIGKIEKKTDKFNLYLNMHGDFNAVWDGSHFDEGKFRMKQLRIEMLGNINNWLSYRYRQRLNKGDNQDGYRDNVLNSIDIAGIGIKLKKFQLFLGKQCAAYGGIEFDENPIEIYQYCDMIEYMSNFMTGINVAYNFTDKQQLQFQMLNSNNFSTKDMYGDYQKSRMPFVYTLNWNGNFGDFYKTRWSASVMEEVKDAQMYYFALGNEFIFSPKVQAFVDWMYSREGVDRKGIMTGILKGTEHERNSQKSEYMSTVVHVNYRFHPKWNVFAKAMYETAGLYKSYENFKKGNYRTSWGYVGGVEFYPFKDRTLHFFAAYVGRDYKYSHRAKELGEENYSTNSLSVGFIWQMPVF